MAKRESVNPQELLDLVMLAAEVVIPAIDARLVDIKGTQAVRLKTANEAVDAVIGNWTPIPWQRKSDGKRNPSSMVNLNDLDAVQLVLVTAGIQESVLAVHAELVKVWLTLNKSTTATEAEALKAKRADHVKDFDAYVNALTQLGWFDDEDPAPVLPKAPGTSTGGSKATSTTIAGLDYQYWYELNGTRTNLNGIQNKFSSLGFYAGAKAKVGTVPAALINGADTKAHSKNHSEAWSATVDYEGHSFTFGMDIVGEAKS